MTRARPFRQTIAGLTLGRVAAATSLLLVAGVLAGTSPAGAAPVAAQPVVLGTAAQYSVLAGPSVTSTGAGTVLALDLGVTGTVAGFPPGTVTGAIHVGDAAVKTAHTDRQAAYESMSPRPTGHRSVATSRARPSRRVCTRRRRPSRTPGPSPWTPPVTPARSSCSRWARR
jgi:hypothetical protein